jgi:hypothetical protein
MLEAAFPAELSGSRHVSWRSALENDLQPTKLDPMIAAVCQEYHLHRHLIGKARQICGMPPEGCNLMP